MRLSVRRDNKSTCSESFDWEKAAEKKRNLLEVLSIHYAGTHGTRMLRRHIIYSFKLNDIYLETPSLLLTLCDRQRTAIYSQLCRAASLFLRRRLLGERKQQSTYLTPAWTLSSLRSAKCVGLAVPVCREHFAFIRFAKWKNHNMWNFISSTRIEFERCSSCHHTHDDDD